MRCCECFGIVISSYVCLGSRRSSCGTGLCRVRNFSFKSRLYRADPEELGGVWLVIGVGNSDGEIKDGKTCSACEESGGMDSK